MHKIKILLEALDELVSRVDYYALDLDKKELDRTLKLVKPGTFKHVSCHGLLGTYDDFKDWLKSLDKSRPICLLSLGSTIGSFERDDAARFLKGFAEALRARSRRCDSRPSDLLLVGIDGCKDEHQVWSAYNDSTDANEKFIRNALTHANAVLGENAFRAEEWERQGRWNSLEGRHEQYLIPNVDVRVNGACLPAGKDILLVCSHKYDAQDRETLFKKSGLESVQSWKSDKTDYGKFSCCLVSITDTCRRTIPACTNITMTVLFESIQISYSTGCAETIQIGVRYSQLLQRSRTKQAVRGAFLLTDR